MKEIEKLKTKIEELEKRIEYLERRDKYRYTDRIGRRKPSCYDLNKAGFRKLVKLKDK